MTTNVAIHGAAGRMGHILLGMIAAADDLTLSAAWDVPGHPDLGRDAYELIGKPKSGILLSTLAEAPQTQVIVDFSLPEGTAKLLEALAGRPAPLVCGTTALDSAAQANLKALAGQVPVVFAPNFSTGVNVLFSLVKQAIAGMGTDIEAELVESHHHHKKDAPSGTAKKLLEIMAAGLGLDVETDCVHGRNGDVGTRPKKQIGVHAIRGGEVVGEHTVYLFGTGERLELTHKAGGREAFARGALTAARWCVGKAPGLYSMSDVLGL